MNMRTIVELKNGKPIRYFRTMLSIEECGFSYNGVYSCAKGMQNTHKGKKFMFLDELDNMKEEKEQLIDYVNRYDLNGNLIKQYATIEETKYDGFEVSLVHRCLKRYTGTIRHRDNLWTYESKKDDLHFYINLNKKNGRRKRTPINMYLEGKEVFKFESMNEAERNGFFASGILRSIRLDKTYLGYKFKYAEQRPI